MTRYLKCLKDTRFFDAIKKDISLKKAAHCYLLVSPDPVALDVSAELFASCLYCGLAPCGECLACRKIRDKSHENIFYYPIGERFTPEDAADFIEKMPYTSGGGSYRIFVVRDFDRITENTQNKLLKTMEEPPEDVIILLLSKSTSAVINTVVSRCRVYNIDPIDTELLAGELRALYNVETSDALWAAKRSRGNIAVAESILRDPVYKAIDAALWQVLLECKSGRDILRFSDKLLKFKDFAEIVLEFLAYNLRDVYLLKIAFGENCPAEKSAELAEIAKVYSVAALNNIIERIILGMRKLKSNVSAPVVIDEILVCMMEEKAKCQK